MTDQADPHEQPKPDNAATLIEPFELSIPQTDLDDLDQRLERTRWPDRETVDDTSQGPPLAKLQALVARWQGGYDWRRCEALLNGFGQYRTEIDGLGIHFLHIRSSEPDALPLVMTHGWPGSVLEFRDVIGPLTDPVAHGGEARDAFNLVIPSLPGFGFSGKPTAPGWNVGRTAAAWTTLMQRLGYTRWGAQGGDWGAAVTTTLGHLAPPGLVGIHLNMVMFGAVLRLLQASEYATAVDRVRFSGLARRAGRLDLRAVPRCVRQRRRSGERVLARRDARRHHALLAAQYRREFRAPLLGGNAGDDVGRRAAIIHAAADWHQHVPRRAGPPVAPLGRAAIRELGAFQRTGPGRPLRRPGAARLVRGRGEDDFSVAAMTRAELPTRTCSTVSLSR